MSNTNDNDSSQEQHHSDHPPMGDNRRHAEHATREGSGGAGRPDSEYDGQDDGHGGGMHAGHEQMFKRRFFVNLVLSIPVLLYSEGFQTLVGFSVPSFPGSEWVSPLFAVIVFGYGGVPFLKMAVPELRDRSPGMMTLISLAIGVSFIYSVGTVLILPGMDFFWELATLIDIMLLGHWIEMRSVRRASSALDELAELMPDIAERLTEDGNTEEVPVSELAENDLVLIRPGASIPADGVVEEGDVEVVAELFVVPVPVTERQSPDSPDRREGRTASISSPPTQGTEHSPPAPRIADFEPCSVVKTVLETVLGCFFLVKTVLQTVFACTSSVQLGPDAESHWACAACAARSDPDGSTSLARASHGLMREIHAACLPCSAHSL